jgi:hypothetical protein
VTQPIDGFTTGDFCSGKWPTNSDYRRAVWALLRQPEPLPKRTPGKYANDKVWQVRV